MPREFVTYVRLRTAAGRRRRCRELFGWTDEEYDKAPARFCDWALAFATAETEGYTARAKREAKAEADKRRPWGRRG